MTTEIQAEWVDGVPKIDPKSGRRVCKGVLELNHGEEQLARIVWFSSVGPYYAWAMDVKDTRLMRRIGPQDNIEQAKERCRQALAGEIDISRRMGVIRTLQKVATK
jgi:hypothetical protein